MAGTAILSWLIGPNRIAFGSWTTVAANDQAIVTGLSRVDMVVVSLQDDPSDDPSWVSALPNATTPGTIDIKSWKNTSGTDPTPVAASTFSKKVNWIAIGA